MREIAAAVALLASGCGPSSRLLPVYDCTRVPREDAAVFDERVGRCGDDRACAEAVMRERCRTEDPAARGPSSPEG